MRIGAVFPRIEFGNDTGALKEYIQTVEGLGYTHLVAYDHVLAPTSRTGPISAVPIRSGIHFTRSSSSSAMPPR